MKPEVMTRLRYEAEAHAHVTASWTRDEIRDEVRTLVYRAYLRGADAGYTARCSEERGAEPMIREFLLWVFMACLGIGALSAYVRGHLEAV